jgi:hypothetical protein
MYGLDVERSRPTDLDTNDYAFSRHERAIVHRARSKAAGLVAWTMKEAAWKALRPAPTLGPAAIELRWLNSQINRALVRVRAPTLRRRGRLLRVRTTVLACQDGTYLLALAAGSVRLPAGAT